ncbi:hypothetical protein SH611_15215 [Geminicoccaceae bacterium 1502E]|nr:hypothetical protein [Geminicoccaceae bacterium 1502E]
MANLRSRPPRLDPDDFIAAAEKPTRSPAPESAPAGSGPKPREQAPKPTVRPAKGGKGRGERPWDAPGVRADVTKMFNLRLPEPLKLKLDFIRQTTRISAHEFIMNALVPAVEAEIERLDKEQQ